MLAALSAGVLFGAGLSLSGMLDPARVLGFLDFAGAWDPSLAFVLGGAVGVSAIGYAVSRRMARPLLAARFDIPDRQRIDGATPRRWHAVRHRLGSGRFVSRASLGLPVARGPAKLRLRQRNAGRDGALSRRPASLGAALQVMQAVLAVLCGGLVGFALGLIGGGGSIMATPLLLYVVGLAPHQAIGTGALAVSVNAFINCAGHARVGNVRWRSAIIFAVAGMAGAALGSTLGKAFDGKRLLFLFAILMIVVGVLMLRRRPITAPFTGERPGSVPRVVAAALVVGTLSGFSLHQATFEGAQLKGARGIGQEVGRHGDAAFAPAAELKLIDDDSEARCLGLNRLSATRGNRNGPGPLEAFEYHAAFGRTAEPCPGDLLTGASRTGDHAPIIDGAVVAA